MLVPGLTPAGPTPQPAFRLVIVRNGSLPPASAPYLAVIGPPPLRFQEPTPPPDLVTRPPAAAPPTPAARPAAAATPVPPAVQPARTAPSKTTPPAEPAAPKPNAPILRDTVRPVVQPEDFLPYFVFPRAGDVSSHGADAAAPAAAAPVLPPSSATYRQGPE